MKKSQKAALWSGLVFPGAGHFYLKRYRRGLIPFVGALLAMALVVRDIWRQAEFVLGKLESAGDMPDIQAIEALLDSAPKSQMVDFAIWVFVICWVIAMVDAYRLGHIADQYGSNSGPGT